MCAISSIALYSDNESTHSTDAKADNIYTCFRETNTTQLVQITLQLGLFT